MRIVATGFGREMYRHEIGRVDLDNMDVAEAPPPRYLASRKYAYRDAELADTVTLAWTEELHLSGRYVVRLHLSKGDVAKLVVAFFRNEALARFARIFR